MIDCSCVATGYDTVPPYAGGVYYRTKYSIITKAYHPFRRKRISLKSTTFVCRQMWCFSWKEREKKIPAPNADTPPAFEQSEAGRRRKRKRTPFSGVLAARTETAETERQVVLLMWKGRSKKIPASNRVQMSFPLGEELPRHRWAHVTWPTRVLFCSILRHIPRVKRGRAFC